MKKSDVTACLYSLVTLLSFMAGYLYGVGEIVYFIVLSVVVIILDFIAVRSWFTSLEEILESYANRNGLQRVCPKSKNNRWHT